MKISKKILVGAVVCAALGIGVTAFAANSANDATQTNAPAVENSAPVAPEASAPVEDETPVKAYPPVPVVSDELSPEGYYVRTYEDGTKAYLAPPKSEPTTDAASDLAEDLANAESGYFTHTFSDGILMDIPVNYIKDSEYKKLGSDTPFMDEIYYQVLEFVDGTKRYFRSYDDIPEDLNRLFEQEQQNGMRLFTEGGCGEYYEEVIDGALISGWR